MGIRHAASALRTCDPESPLPSSLVRPVPTPIAH